MEFLDEFESKPRFLLQSKQHFPQSDSAPSSSSLFSSFRLISVSCSLVFFSLAFIYIDVEPLRSLLLWVSFSILVGPFAPPSLTAGDIRVGLGPPLYDIPKASIEVNEKFNRKTTKTIKKAPEDADIGLNGYLEKSATRDGSLSEKSDSSLSAEKKYEEKWNEADEEVLRKLMGKYPVGMPGRWEAIAEGLNGKHKVETVITRAKEMGDRKGMSDQDSYSKFLKDRKQVDKRVLDEGVNAEIGIVNENVGEESKVIGWSAAEDLALLNALKTFPKEVAMRWEKIAASVPGKTKSACMKRVTELKKDFRSSKA